MARRLERVYPSFSLVLNEAFGGFQLSAYDLPSDQDTAQHSAGARRTYRLEDPLMTTIDWRFHEPYFVPMPSWNHQRDVEPEAQNLQAALEFDENSEGASVSKSRRFSDLVIDLAFRIRQRCTVRSLRRQRASSLVRVSYLDLAS
ncbi:hypothetical protein OE88DRAFT_1642187 [Heliocybe sulcata]|uniref:Uncharacterized protein n=1 Tax=Heliocybe sulcata TaxID=5364 RepID=A0A5C3ND02_9AGAM|nr:hypothetical protein OE88DRAFT_1642187 [Heliocybe sulcata]